MDLKKGTYLNFQDKKDFNFTNKSQTNISPNSGNIYSALVLNKVISTQKLNNLNLANNEYFLAKSINIQKTCEVNPERLPVFATRKNTKNLGKVNYKKIGYNKHTLYNIFKLMRRDKFFLNEKFYQNLLGKRAFSFFNSGMKHYSRAVREIKKYNDFVDNQIWNIADRRNQYFLNIFDISAYTYHSYVDVTKEKNENKYVKGARLFLDIWDSVDDYSSYWYADYWYDATFPTNMPAENMKRIAENMKNLRDYETFYGMFRCREKMKKHLWRLRVGKTMYLNTFSKNATRINFLNGIGAECVTNNWRSRSKSGSSLLRFLYTKYLFPRNRAESWENYSKFNVFAPNLETSENGEKFTIEKKAEVAEGFKFNFINFLGKRTNVEGANISQTKTSVKSPYNNAGIKLKYNIGTKEKSVVKNKKNMCLFSSIKVINGQVLSKKNKKNELISKFSKNGYNLFKKFKFKKNLLKSKVLVNTRLHLNRVRLKALIINSLFGGLRLTELTNLKKNHKRLSYMEDAFVEFKHYSEKVWSNSKIEDPEEKPLEFFEKLDLTFRTEDNRINTQARNLDKKSDGKSVNIFKFNKIFLKKFNPIEDDIEISISGNTGISKLTRWAKKNKSEPKTLKRFKLRRFKAKYWIETLHILRVYSAMSKTRILSKIFEKKINKNKNYTVKSLAEINRVYRKYSSSKNLVKKYNDYFETITKNKIKSEQTLGSYIFAKKVKKTKKYRENFLKQDQYVNSKALNSVFIMNMAMKSKVKLNQHFAKINNLKNHILGNLMLHGTGITNTDRFTNYSSKLGLNLLVPFKGSMGKKYIDGIKSNIKFRKIFYSEIENCTLNTTGIKKFYFKKLKNFKINNFSSFKVAKLAGKAVLVKREKEIKYYNFEKTKIRLKFKDIDAAAEILDRKKRKREKLFAIVNDYLGIARVNNYLLLGKSTLNQLGVADKFEEETGTFKEKMMRKFEILFTAEYFPFHKDYLENYIDSWKAISYVFSVDIAKGVKATNATTALTKIWGNDFNRLGMIYQGNLKELNKDKEIINNLPKHMGRLAFLFQPNIQNLEIELPEDFDSELVRLQSKTTELNSLDDFDTPLINFKPSPILEFERLGLWGHTVHRAKALRLATFTQNNISRVFSTWDDDNYPLSNFYFNLEEIVTAHNIEENKTINLRKRPVFGKAALFRQTEEGWMHVIHKHQFLRDVHTQVGTRKYPEIWYKPGRKKYPLKLHKKDWALKIPLASRIQVTKGASSTTSTYDSSVVYYRNIGWASWTRFFKRMPIMKNFYRYGRDGDPIQEIPLGVMHTGGGEQMREDAIYEEYLGEFSLLGHNWFDFVPTIGQELADDHETREAIVKFEYQRGKETLVDMRRHFKPYRDAMKNWFKRLKPMFSYSGIKTYNRYNQYVMQKNNEIKTNRYKTLFTNYAFAQKLDKARFSANIININFFNITAKAFELSNTNMQLINIKKLNRKALYLQYLSLKTTKYKYRKTVIDSKLFLDSTKNSVETLRKTNRDYLADEIYDSKVGEFEDQNKSAFVMTRDQFRFINRTYRSTLETQGRFKNLDMQHGLKTFVAKSPYWW